MLKLLNLTVFGVLLLLLGTSLGNDESDQFYSNQNDYQIIFERAELVSYNKEYVQRATLVTFKYNRTCTAFNGTANFNLELGHKPEVVVQSYKFASNEYRLFPMRFQFNLCQALSNNVFGAQRILKCGNFSGCPLEKKKSYRICNFTPDASHFPPLVPSGRYMLEMQVLYFSTEIAVIRGYGEITRPFKGT